MPSPASRPRTPVHVRQEMTPMYLEPKTYNADPLWAATVGVAKVAAREFSKMGYVSNKTLYAMSQTFVPAAIIAARTNDVCDFAEHSTDPMKPGWTIEMRDPRQVPTRNDRKQIRRLIEAFQRGGGDFWPNGMEGLLRALVPQSSVYDKYVFEPVRDKDWVPYCFVPVDCTTIVKSIPIKNEEASGHWYPRGNQTAYYQVVGDGVGSLRVVGEYTRDELCWGVRNPSTLINTFGMGTPELEKGIPLLTDILGIHLANSGRATAGLRPDSMIIVGTNDATQKFNARRADIEAQMASSTTGRRRIPMFQIDPALKESITTVPLHRLSSEMEMEKHLMLLIQFFSALFDMPTDRFGLSFGNQGQSASIVDNGRGTAAKIHKGHQSARPMLRNLASTFNQAVWSVFPQYAFRFTGFDPKTEKERLDAMVLAVNSWMSPNEARLTVGLDPWDDPVSVRPLNAQYSAWTQHQMEEQDSYTDATPQDTMAEQGFGAFLEGRRLNPLATP